MPIIRGVASSFLLSLYRENQMLFAYSVAIVNYFFESVDKDVVISVAFGYPINTMAVQYQRDEHRVHLVVYHLIFCPKRRKSFLVGAVAKECERLLALKCEQNGWQAITLVVQPDHVYLLVRVFPTNAAADVVKELKAYTSHELRLKFPELKRRLPSLWTRSYFASTTDEISDETIRNYIQAQKGA